MEVLLILAVLPAFALMFYVYKKDTVEKEPIGLIVRLFVLGMVAGPLAAIVETLLFNLFEGIFDPGPVLLVIEFFVGVAAVEEGFKYLFLSTIRKNPNFNYVFDGIVYAVAVALGFAALENVFYVFDGGLEVAVMRAIFSVPGHCADGVVMGCFFGLARQHEIQGRKSAARTNYLLAFILPVIEHGLYDTALSAESDVLALFAMGFQLAFILFAAFLVRKISKTDSPMDPSAEIPAPVDTATLNQQAPPPLQQPTANHFHQPDPNQFQQPAPNQFQQPSAQYWNQSNQQLTPNGWVEINQQPAVNNWDQANQQGGPYPPTQNN